jgi:hypothetical protein
MGIFKLLTKLQVKASVDKGTYSILSEVEVTDKVASNLVSKGFLKKIEQYCIENGVNLANIDITQ